MHLLLTLVTLGVYSPWAKVRKMKWFAQHTSLMGDRFDYHADPRRILIGRAIALLLLLLWVGGFLISVSFGLTVLALLCVIGPVLFVEAQRFKLHNTSWRGFRFGFEAPRKKAYLMCLPPLLLWASLTVAEALGATGSQLLAVGVVVLLGWPWAHARLKTLQHDHASFGAHRFSFGSATEAYYELYVRCTVLVVITGLTAAILGGVILEASRAASSNSDTRAMPPFWFGLVAATLTLILSWPFFAARHQQLVWARTWLGNIAFRGEMKAWPLLKLVLVQSVLVLLTLGLYWPFAAVALARYRVQAIGLSSSTPLEDMVIPAAPSITSRATGDASADAFGLDLGW